MAPDTEKELLEKVNEIHGYIFGVQGRPGAMEKVDAQLELHDKRIVSLERWRWYVAGAGFVVLCVVKIIWGH